jgi:hypothetical protein
MTKSVKWLVGALIAITAASVIAVVFMAAHRPDTDDEDEQEAVKTPSHVSVQSGRTVITLDPQTQAREGIRVAPLRETSMRAEIRGTSVLLAVNDLAALRNGYVAARTKLQRDQIDLNVSRTQEERIKSLYEQNQNMSLKAMQDAEAAYRNNQAQVNADEQDANLQLDTVRQRWGTVAAKWVERSTPTLDSVLSQRAFLAQVVFPPGEVATAPATLSLALPGNQVVRARLVSPLPQVNPEIQGISFLYIVPSRPGMAVGMNLLVLVPVGQLLRGTIIPESAVVWWQGKAWAYEQTATNTFTRQDVPTSNPVTGGYFVPGTIFPPGTKVVFGNAQALLSEEFRSQIQQED